MNELQKTEVKKHLENFEKEDRLTSPDSFILLYSTPESASYSEYIYF
jgi:hypothetical protein